MARTVKWEHPSDPIRTIWRDERRARQPQRNRDAFYADLALDGDGVQPRSSRPYSQ